MAGATIRLGLKEQLIFPEIQYDEVASIHGMDITIVTTARTNDEGKALLTHLGCRSERSARRNSEMRREVQATGPMNGGRSSVSRLALRNKTATKPKFATRATIAVALCGRVRGFLRRFRMCRICFRLLSLNGEIPGVRKSSW